MVAKRRMGEVKRNKQLKITKQRLKQIIREEVEKVYKHPLARGIQVIRTSREKRPASGYDYDPAVGTIDSTYDILDQQGNKIGFLENEGYLGGLDGELYDRHLPDLKGYGSKGAGPLGRLQTFFKSKTGRKWLDVSLRQMQRNK